MDLNNQIDQIKSSYIEGMTGLFKDHLKKTKRDDVTVIPERGFANGQSPDLTRAMLQAQAETILQKEMAQQCSTVLIHQRDDILITRIQSKDSTLVTKSHCRKCYGRGFSGVNIVYERDRKGVIALTEKGEKKVKSASYQICQCLIAKNPITPSDEAAFRKSIVLHYIALQAKARKQPTGSKGKAKNPKPGNSDNPTSTPKVRTPRAKKSTNPKGTGKTL